MNREFLKELGLDEETVNKVMAEHGKALNNTKTELSTVKAEVDSYKEQLSEQTEQLKKLGESAGDNEALTAQIEALKQANKEAQEHMSKLNFNHALERQLTAAQARNIKSVKALLDLDTIKLDGDKLIGLTEQLDNLKESDGYLFGGDTKAPTTDYSPGSGQKGNNPKDTDPYEAGKQMAMSRHNKGGQ